MPDTQAPAQLDPAAFSILCQISGQNEPVHYTNAPEEDVEMRETATPPTRRLLGLVTKNIRLPKANDDDGDLSALSVPSPGGIFASFDGSGKECPDAQLTPTTGIATEFYRTPFPAQLNPGTQSLTSTSLTEPEPATARKITFLPAEVQSTAAPDLDRTEQWLSVQCAKPKEPVRAANALAAAEVSPSTLCVHSGIFWEGWRHMKHSQHPRDAFQHRQARVEAEHVMRTSCNEFHVEQLKGNMGGCLIPSGPISGLSKASDDKKKMNSRVDQERRALEWMQSSAWAISAQEVFNGGQLLISLKGRKNLNILDLAGQAYCGWAWSVAAEHPDASVFTVTTDKTAYTLDGPANHSFITAQKLWQLPFKDDTFDAISARNLYVHLRTMWPKGQAADEWDLTLRECLRVLKCGGTFEFSLLDADLVHPQAAGHALGVEFAFNLKTRGYDPCATKSFLSRLKSAGFVGIKRAWMVLPVADVVPQWTDSGKYPASNEAGHIDPNGEIRYYEPPVTGSTKDVRAMTGLIGARMWEQWILKLNSEMGRSEERCLEGIAKAL